jgi:hypothetical protein
MFYYLYEITNKVNDKIYVGVHKTSDLNDGLYGLWKDNSACNCKAWCTEFF